MCSEAALRDRLQALCGVLDRDADLHGAVPFRTPRPAWLTDQGDLARTLLALDDATVDRLETDPGALQALLGAAAPSYRDLPALTAVPPWPSAPLPALPGHAPERDVPGRKWAQILAFAAARRMPADAPILDWCSGKGHLGRLLGTLDGVPVRCVERSPELCAAGGRLDAGRPPTLRFQCRDVLADGVAPEPDEVVVALHACGHLHETLVERAVASGARAVALAPCCYHLLAPEADGWQPLSRTGPDRTLTRDQARLAVQDTVTAPNRIRRLRTIERSYRLGFDLLQRDLRGDDAPLPLPSLPKRLFGAGFETFCRHAAAHCGLALPPAPALEPWLARGRRLEARTRRLDLARAGFRRALELRMVLDRALRLSEAGYRVGVGRFCARQLTPRNLLIQAL